MISLLKKFWLIAFLVGSLVFLLDYFFEQATLVTKPLYFSWVVFISTFLIHILFWLMASFIWKYLLLITSDISISPLQSFSQLVLVSIGKYMPGKIWGMIARGTQLKELGISAKKIFIITVQEQILLLHASAIMSSILIFFLLETKWNYGLIIFALFSLLLGRQIQFWFVSLYNRLTNDNLDINITQRNYLSLTIAYMLLWILSGCIFSGIYFTFITQTEFDLTIMAWLILANTVSITVGFFALFAPAGIGVRESVASVILAQVIPLEQAIFLSLLFRLWIVVTELSLGIVVGYFIGKNIFKKPSVKN